MESIIKYLMPMTNYSVTNTPNLYNFLYTIFVKLDQQQKKEFVTQMKLLMGLEFVTQFKAYLFRKINTSELFTFFE